MLLGHMRLVTTLLDSADTEHFRPLDIAKYIMSRSYGGGAQERWRWEGGSHVAAEETLKEGVTVKATHIYY